MKTCAVIAAAGMSSRMKSFKPLLSLGDHTLIGLAVQSLTLGGVDKVVVIIGHRGEEIKAVLKNQPVVFVKNPRYEVTDMLMSAKYGFQFCADNDNDYENVLFLPADIPAFSPETVKMLLEFGKKKDYNVIKPTFEGKAGHPILIKKSILPQILAFTGENGLKGALSPFKDSTLYLACPDKGITLDADRPQDYQLLVKYYQSLIETRGYL